MTAPVIELDASNWKEFEDFHRAFCLALGAPDWHGCNIDAYLDSIIWGEINKINPPYTIRIINAKNMPPDIREFIDILQDAMLDHRAESKMRRGYDVDAKFEIIP